MTPPPAEKGAAPSLTAADLSQVFVRSFFFQSLWSFQRMQNVGWLFSLWPVLRRLNPDPVERAKAAQDHGGYFNTHPYTADIILGVVAGLEEKRARDGSVSRERILEAKMGMSGPLSALGETVFWAVGRPLFLAGAVTAGALSPRLGWWLAPLLYVSVFNLFHLAVKAGGLYAGYKRGLDVAAFLVQWPIQRWSEDASRVGLGLCAGVLAVLVFRCGAPWALGLLFALGSLAALRRGLPPAWLLPAAGIMGILKAL